MVQFKIEFDETYSPALYQDYSKFVFESVIDTLRDQVNLRKYKVRESQVLESSVINWTHKPRTVNLYRLVEDSLVLRRENGVYTICLDSYKYVPGSKTKLSTLVRLLEYGNEKIQPYPLVSSVLHYFAENYKFMVLEFMKARMIENESVPLRKVTGRTFEVSSGRRSSSYNRSR